MDFAGRTQRREAEEAMQTDVRDLDVQVRKILQVHSSPRSKISSDAAEGGKPMLMRARAAASGCRPPLCLLGGGLAVVNGSRSSSTLRCPRCRHVIFSPAGSAEIETERRLWRSILAEEMVPIFASAAAVCVLAGISLVLFQRERRSEGAGEYIARQSPAPAQPVESGGAAGRIDDRGSHR